MLGFVRFILAGLVVANHFYLPVANKVGAHAVIAFYMMSGYLMARVLNHSYGFSPAGTLHFLLNRFLRIFPIYWIVLLLSCVCLYLDRETFGVYGTLMQIPPNLAEWFRNVTLYNLTWSPTITIPPSWSLSVEFFFYITMALFLARNQRIVSFWLGASVIITIYLVLSGASFRDRYYPVYSASLFFSVGAAVYYFWNELTRFIPRTWIAIVLLALFIPFPLVVEGLGGDRLMLGYYGAAGLFVPIMLWAIANRSFDHLQILGDFAYPVFLTHFLAAGFVRWIWGPGITGKAALFFCAVLILTLSLSVVIHLGLERQVNRIRAAVRQYSVRTKQVPRR
jgi:peptidoglycan/LPS O-acetylase OafA/YrhL